MGDLEHPAEVRALLRPPDGVPAEHPLHVRADEVAGGRRPAARDRPVGESGHPVDVPQRRGLPRPER